MLIPPSAKCMLVTTAEPSDFKGAACLRGPWTVILRLMSTLNPHPPVGQPAPLSPASGQPTVGERPAWVEFALQEALLVKDDDVPADLAERHDEYALRDDLQS